MADNRRAGLGVPRDAAGGSAGAFVHRIEGDFYNVMGLPIQRLYQELKKFQTPSPATDGHTSTDAR